MLKLIGALVVAQIQSKPYTSHHCKIGAHVVCLGFYGGKHCSCACHKAHAELPNEEK